MHLGIPEDSLPDGVEKPRQPESRFLLLLDPQMMCSWLLEGQAEVVIRGKVWKTQLGRGQCGKEELEGRDRM